MIHEIELTTVETFIVVEALMTNKFIHPEDKEAAKRAVSKILKSVSQDFKESEKT